MNLNLRGTLTVKFQTIVTVFIFLWLCTLAVLITKGADKALSKQAKVFINSLENEQGNEKKLFQQALKEKGASISALLCKTASGLIDSYDYDSLIVLAQNTAKDADIKFVAFYDTEGHPLTEEPDNKTVFHLIGSGLRAFQESKMISFIPSFRSI